MVPPVELVPFLFRIRLTAARSVAFKVAENVVAFVAVTLAVVSTYVAPPSPVKVNLVRSIVSPAVMLVPVTTSEPVLASYVALVMVGGGRL